MQKTFLGLPISRARTLEPGKTVAIDYPRNTSRIDRLCLDPGDDQLHPTIARIKVLNPDTISLFDGRLYGDKEVLSREEINSKPVSFMGYGLGERTRIRWKEK